MINETILNIKKIIDIVNPTFVYIAIDGVAPFSKMNQQRQRRYKSVLQKKIDKDIEKKVSSEFNIKIEDRVDWDPNAISPGTHFMKNLSTQINYSIKNNHFGEKDIIFSDSEEPGEGEHKILQYIKHNKNMDNTIIYGLDADLIMLSLSSGLENIYLLRESVEFGKVIQDKYLYLDIDHLKYGLTLTLKEKILQFDNCYMFDNKNLDNLIDDYIFVCYFLGNDFLPHIPGLDLKNNGHDILLDIYVS